jgi:hypothetical protein
MMILSPRFLLPIVAIIVLAGLLVKTGVIPVPANIHDVPEDCKNPKFIGNSCDQDGGEITCPSDVPKCYGRM